MILHDEVYNEIAQIHCKVESGSLRVFETIQIFCNSKDSVKYLKAKAEAKIEQENGKIPFLSVIEFSVLKRMSMNEPIILKMETPQNKES